MELASQNMPSKEATWTVSLHGSFRLTSPNGEVVQLKNHKVEALFGVLVQHREFGITRDELATILWPGKPYEQQKASLRQALSLCRKAIGASSIESSRTHCRIADSFKVEVLPGSGIFMPGHEGEYFDEIRSDDLACGTLDPERRSVLGAWLQVLEWHAVNDPNMLFNMLRMAPHQAEGLAFADLERLLVQASGGPKNAWVEYWWGTVLDNLEDCQKHLRTALTAAIDQHDYDLASKVCLELGRVYSRTGRIKRALSVSKLADDVAARSGSVVHLVNALRLKATINFQWGDPKRGNSLFLKAIQKAPTTMEQHQLTASLAFFQAGYGFSSQARANLAKIDSYAGSLGHMKMDLLVQLTQYFLLAHSSEPRNCYDLIVREQSGNVVQPNSQMDGYLQELLSGLCERFGDKKLAALHRARADAERKKTRDVPTLWVEVLRGNSVVGHALV